MTTYTFLDLDPSPLTVIRELEAENAKLLAAIKRIDAINDNPAWFNKEINDVCDGILRPTRPLPQHTGK
jgi:hypothetical protein